MIRVKFGVVNPPVCNYCDGRRAAFYSKFKGGKRVAVTRKIEGRAGEQAKTISSKINYG